MARTAGQIIKRGKNKWLVRIDMGRDANGKRIRINKTIHGTKDDAQRVLNKMLAEKDMGTLAEASRMSLNEYLDYWLETAVKPRVRERTHKEYGNTLRRYVREPLGARRLSSIKPIDVQTLYSGMQTRGLTDSVRYTNTILKDALTQAVKWQLLSQNPADFVDLPRQSKNKMRALSQEEANRFLEVAKANKWHCFFNLLIGTGLRPSEALGLFWQDIDFARSTVSVKRSLGRVNGKWVFEEPKTESSSRTIPLPLGLVTLLSDYMTAKRELRLEGELVFSNIDGNPIHESNIAANHFKPLLKKAGLPHEVRLYDLRHTHATLLLLAGVHPKVVAERLGHSNITITLNTYSHVLPNMQREAAAKLEAMLYNTAQPDDETTSMPN